MGSIEVTKKAAKRWVVKIGSALLTDNGNGLDTVAIASWVAQMAELRQQGIEIVLVSSGSVAAGVSQLGWKQRPHELHELQAAAAVGQMSLVQTYESSFQRFDQHTAQILLVHTDLSDRGRYLNARNTLTTLLGMGVVPVVNENDTVATDEIRFGDNDTLAGMVANLIDADTLIILTDQDGLFDSDPRKNQEAKLIKEAKADDPSLREMASGSAGELGRGGMITKIMAAKLAARSGTHTVIAGGCQENVLIRLANGEAVGTRLLASNEPLAARKQWLAGQLKVRGRLTLDDSAVRMVAAQERGLLPVGVSGVSGNFARGELVSCLDGQGNEIARGLANYDAIEVAKLIGASGQKITELLGYEGDEELIHHDNLAVL